MKNLEAAVTLHLEFLRIQKHFKKLIQFWGTRKCKAVVFGEQEHCHNQLLNVL